MTLFEVAMPQAGKIYTVREIPRPGRGKGDYEGEEVALIGSRGEGRQYKVLFLDTGDVDNMDSSGDWGVTLVNGREPTSSEKEKIEKAMAFVKTLPKEE